MIFVGLEDGKITLRPEGGRTRKFDRDNHEGIGNFLAKHWGQGFLSSSSINHPQEYGFPRTFDVARVMAKAIEHGRLKKAIRIKPRPLPEAAEAVEKAAEAWKKSLSFPIPMLFLRSGKDGLDQLVTFYTPSELVIFLNGIRYGVRMVEAFGSK